jgi:hypothetical protein
MKSPDLFSMHTLYVHYYTPTLNTQTFSSSMYPVAYTRVCKRVQVNDFNIMLYFIIWSAVSKKSTSRSVSENHSGYLLLYGRLILLYLYYVYCVLNKILYYIVVDRCAQVERATVRKTDARR